MNWLFNITATSAPRLLMRVAMIFDQQSLTLSALDWHCLQETSITDIRLCVCCEEALARRLHAKLFHLQNVVDVELLPDAGGPPMEDGPAGLPSAANVNSKDRPAMKPAFTTEA